MKTFQTVRASFAFLGLDPEQLTFPYNSRLLLAFIIGGLNITLGFSYIFWVASSLIEYVECINTTFGSICAWIGIGPFVFLTPKIFENMDRVERMIESSE